MPGGIAKRPRAPSEGNDFFSYRPTTWKQNVTAEWIRDQGAQKHIIRLKRTPPVRPKSYSQKMHLKGQQKSDAINNF